ncbi:MAG: carbohydrate ABC transporter permease [Anaerolinea sp.]|mgnify:CR=1 FL=1|nr:carbohydrate ABC transporter permease [Anaerolinea sp.]MCC6973546.1 carbohydrate ABC transporter permease [Anaerolineae bacterium]CAG1008328.1 L-arabinose transport system permease protein AraQ [Anaerolineae bacterium]
MSRNKFRRLSGVRNRGINPRGFHVSQIKFYVLLMPLAIFMLLPIIFVISNAFKPPDELFAYPPRFFVTSPTLKNFSDLFSKMSTSGIPVSRYLFNSILITLVTVAASIIVSSMAAYALSKKRFKLKKTLFAVNNVALMFVPIAVTIPRFLVIERLNLLDSFWVHILPVLAMPVGLFLLKQFIDGIPDEVIEAAQIDGASDWRIYWRIILPLIQPALATIAILTFQAAWNNADTSSLYLNNESLRTFAFYLSTLTSTTTGANAVAGQGIAAAAALIMFLPNLLIFIFLQSQVMSTMSHSGLK